jgi:hypothetical protein
LVKSAYHLAIQNKRIQSGMLESSRHNDQHKGMYVSLVGHDRTW